MSDDPNADRIAAADAPTSPLVISTNYGDKRTCTDDKGHAIANCKPTDFHPGVDLAGPKMLPVYAPHDGWLLFAGPVSDTQAPFAGYGPAVVLIAHDDVSDSWWDRLKAWGTPSWWPTAFKGDADRGTAQSGAYSLLAHLDAASLPFQRAIDSRVQEVWGATRVNNANWRSVWDWNLGSGAVPGMQHVMKFQPGDGRTEAADHPTDASARYVRKGTVIGFIGDAGHVHWEVRTSPLGLARAGQAMDPMRWLERYKGPLGMPIVDTPPAKDSSWLLWLAAAYAASEL